MDDDLLPPVLPELAHMDPQFRLGHAAARQECAEHFATRITALEADLAAAHAELARLREVPGDYLTVAVQAACNETRFSDEASCSFPKCECTSMERTRAAHDTAVAVVAAIGPLIKKDVADERERAAGIIEANRLLAVARIAELPDGIERKVIEATAECLASLRDLILHDSEGRADVE